MKKRCVGGRLNAEAPLGLPGETHSIGGILFRLCRLFCISKRFDPAPTVSPKGPDANQMGPGANPYRQDLRAPQPQFFDLDLDLNPDCEQNYDYSSVSVMERP